MVLEGCFIVLCFAALVVFFVMRCDAKTASVTGSYKDTLREIEEKDGIDYALVPAAIGETADGVFRVLVLAEDEWVEVFNGQLDSLRGRGRNGKDDGDPADCRKD